MQFVGKLHIASVAAFFVKRQFGLKSTNVLFLLKVQERKIKTVKYPKKYYAKFSIATRIRT